MNEINFLPESFIRQRARKRRVMRESLLVAALVVGMGVWYGLAKRGLQGLIDSADAVESQVAAGGQSQEAKGLHARYVELAFKRDTTRQLVCPINVSQVLGVIASVTPPTVTVRTFNLKDKGLEVWVAKTKDRERQKALEEANKAKGAKAKSRKAAATQGPKYDPPIMEIRIEALAPSDVEITDFVGHLTQNPLFDNVKLYYTRSTTVGERLARQFSLQMEVKLDRLYAPAEKAPRAKEVVHAD